jgi:hypothetical protein
MRGVIAVVVMLAACGDSIDVAPDAPLDASTPDQVVRVRVAVPDVTAGVRVFFQDPDSALLLATRTDEEGRANAFMPRGGYVTVLTTDGEVWTWGGVEPGDDLVLGAAPVLEEPAMLLSIPDDPDAASYWLHAPCTGSFHEVTGAQELPRLVTLPGCGSPTDLLIITREVGFQRIAHYRAALDVELGTADVPKPIEIPAPYETPRANRVAVTNVPQGIGFLYVHQELHGTHGVLFDTSMFGQATIDTQGSRETTLVMPGPQGATVATYLDDTGSVAGTNLLHVVHWGPPGDVAIDLGALALPTIAGMPHFVAADHALHWQQTITSVTPEAAIATIQLSTGARWHVLAPPRPPNQGALALALPRLPIALDVGNANVTTFVTLHSSTGFDAYREHLLGWSPRGRWPISGVSGLVSYSEHLAE